MAIRPVLQKLLSSLRVPRPLISRLRGHAGLKVPLRTCRPCSDAPWRLHHPEPLLLSAESPVDDESRIPPCTTGLGIARLSSYE